MTRKRSTAPQVWPKSIAWLRGAWNSQYAAETMIYRCDLAKGKLNIASLGKIDWEQDKATNIRVTRTFVSFQIYYRSTKYRTWHVFSPMDSNRIRHEFTYRNVRRKTKVIGSRTFRRSPDYSRSAPASKIGRLIGRWEGDEDNMVYEIRLHGRRMLKVRVENKYWDRSYTVRKTRWNGAALEFEVHDSDSSGDSRWRVRITPKSHARAVFEQTQWDTLVALGWHED